MKNIIVGTAGHIDHGKSTLIKAITGRATDRLKEEVERGISIELGFTYFDLPSGRRAGIVDVPGHEKFIKNMLAGITGIDIVVLVVAADEGIMPQTKEHLDILNLLGIKKGIIAVTKMDSVDEEWLELVMEDIREGVQDTFLEDAEMIPVSSTEKTGISELVSKIDEITETVEDRDIYDTPRLPVDRVFTISGFGTVVTGTLIAGKFKVGDEVEVFPKELPGRIRSIQVHGESEEEAYAGQRVAINVVGPKKSEIDRGDVIAPKDSMEPSMMFDVKLRLLADAQRIIENRTRVRLYIGSSEVLCRVVLLDVENLTPGDECYAQLRLEEPIVAKRGDRFILRFYSPMMTIGGGIVLDPNPSKKKRFENSTIEELKLKEKGDPLEIFGDIIRSKSSEFPSIKELSTATTSPEDKLEKMVEELVEKGSVVAFDLSKERHVVSRSYFDEMRDRIAKDIDAYHKKYPLRAGISKEEVRSKYLKGAKQRVGDLFIAKLVDEQVLRDLNDKVSLLEFEVDYSGEYKDIKEYIESAYAQNRFGNLKREDVTKELLKKHKKLIVDQVFESLFENDILRKLKDEVILDTACFEEAKTKIVDYLKQNGEVAVGEIRDLLDTNRKVALSVVETLDDLKVTKREGDKRVLV